MGPDFSSLMEAKKVLFPQATKEILLLQKNCHSEGACSNRSEVPLGTHQMHTFLFSFSMSKLTRAP